MELHFSLREACKPKWLAELCHYARRTTGNELKIALSPDRIRRGTFEAQMLTNDPPKR